MTNASLEERINDVWKQLEVLGYPRHVFRIDRYGQNTRPDAPEHTLLISRITLISTGFQEICGDHRIYERNFLVALEKLHIRLRAMEEWK